MTLTIGSSPFPTPLEGQRLRRRALDRVPESSSRTGLHRGSSSRRPHPCETLAEVPIGQGVVGMPRPWRSDVCSTMRRTGWIGAEPAPSEPADSVSVSGTRKRVRMIR